MSAAEGVPAWARPVLEALMYAANMSTIRSDDHWASLFVECEAALASDAGAPEGERCPYCSFAPESLNDYCDKHRPTFFSAAPASGETLTAHALIAPLIPYLKHDTNCGADDGLACICGKQKAEAEFKRLYRAATGEVVASGVVADYNWERGRLIVNLDNTPESDGKRPNRGTRVVVRRDKEGV